MTLSSYAQELLAYIKRERVFTTFEPYASLDKALNELIIGGFIKGEVNKVGFTEYTLVEEIKEGSEEFYYQGYLKYDDGVKKLSFEDWSKARQGNAEGNATNTRMAETASYFKTYR